MMTLEQRRNVARSDEARFHFHELICRCVRITDPEEENLAEAG